MQNRLRSSINRRRTQTNADSIFSLLDLSKEKLHALNKTRQTVLFLYNIVDGHHNIDYDTY
jgi:hypothetical protein